jgi:hypothetical protein
MRGVTKTGSRPAPADVEATIVLRHTRRRGFDARLALAGLAVATVLAAGAATFLLYGQGTIPIDTETEAQIDASQPCQIKVSRFAADPAIIVVDFPSLRSQGLMLDRVAALIEKAHLPRDRVLDDVALNEAITSCSDTIETYYYGHDYRAADLAKFFRLAARDGVTLNAQELWLKSLLSQLGWLAPGANGALITLPAAIAPITEEMRAVILHHELSHGAFYTVPAYASYAAGFWNSLTPVDRAAFRNFLGTEGYDTTNNELMLNETQAYLIFTRDPRFFNGGVVGMSESEIDTLRGGYIAGMPDFWLTPMADAALPVGPAPLACPAA